MVKAYSKYKDSGVPWLGEIPEHWEMRKLRQVLRQVAVRNRPDLPLLSVVREKGVILRDVSNQDENHNFIPDDLSNYKVVRTGQFAMNKMKAWQGSYGVSHFDGIVSPAYFVFEITGVEGEYFHTAIRSRAYVPFFTHASEGVRIGQWDLSHARMREAFFFVPPVPEQVAIVRFLDHVDRRIHRYIRAKQQVMKLLNEQKQAIINKAVTCGVDPNVRLKPSGVDWLGDIPEHWETRKISSCLESIITGVWGDDPTDKNLNDHIICVRVADFDMLNLRISKKKLTIRAIPLNTCQSRLLQQDDILIEKSGGGDAQPVGRAVVYDLKEPAVSSNFISRLRPNQLLMRPYFLLYVLTLFQLRRHNMLSIKQTTGIQNLDIKHYFSNWIAFPSLGEQDKIINSIENQFESITQVQQLVYRDIELIREYRTRLISDAVTGKIDVRDIKLPEIEDITNSEPIEEQESLEDIEDTEEVVNADE